MSETLVSSRDWAEIPYFRKPWFLVLLFLVFMPGYLVVLWTGDTFYRRADVVYRTSRKQKIMQTLVVVVLMVSFLLRHPGRVAAVSIGKLIETVLHWAFAVVATIVVFFTTMAAFAFLMLKVLGVPIGGPVPADFQPAAGAFLTSVAINSMMLAPLAAASFVGAVSVPYRHRGIAAVLFPAVLFATFNLLPLASHKPLILLPRVVLLSAVSCAVPGGFVYWSWRRHRARVGR